MKRIKRLLSGRQLLSPSNNSKKKERASLTLQQCQGIDGPVKPSLAMTDNNWTRSEQSTPWNRCPMRPSMQSNELDSDFKPFLE